MSSSASSAPKIKRLKVIPGPVIGRYMDKPIFDYCTDDQGVVRKFAGVVKQVCEIPPGAIVIGAGLLYELMVTGNQ